LGFHAGVAAFTTSAYGDREGRSMPSGLGGTEMPEAVEKGINGSGACNDSARRRRRTMAVATARATINAIAAPAAMKMVRYSPSKSIIGGGEPVLPERRRPRQQQRA